MEIVRRGNEEAHPLAALEPLADRIEDLEVLVPAELAGEPEPKRLRRHVLEPLDHTADQ